VLNDKRIKSCLSRFDSGAYSRLQFLRAAILSALIYGVPTPAGRQQQQQQQQRGRRRVQAGARASSDNFRGVVIGNGSHANNLGRLLRSVLASHWCRADIKHVDSIQDDAMMTKTIFEIDLSINHTMNHYFIVRPIVVQSWPT